MTDTPKLRLAAVRERIAQAAASHGRAPDDIELLAVSKGHSVDAVVALVELGHRSFGESYASEATGKVMPHPELDWHFIGPVQSNKTRTIATHYDWVHSIDRSKILRRLQEQRPQELEPLNICLQVNIDNEDSKAGVSPDEAHTLAHEAMKYDRLRLRGLMAIPRPRDQLDNQRAPFRRLRRLFDQFNERGCNMDTLSMGMSNDIEAAIAEGATIVRVGTALFGPRQR